MLFWHVDTRTDCWGPYCIPVPKAILAAGENEVMTRRSSTGGIIETSVAHSSTDSGLFTLHSAGGERDVWALTCSCCDMTYCNSQRTCDAHARTRPFYLRRTTMAPFIWREQAWDILTLRWSWQQNATRDWKSHRIKWQCERNSHVSGFLQLRIIITSYYLRVYSGLSVLTRFSATL